MIDNENGRKNNVIVQWVSRDYLISHKKDLKSIPVVPDEYCVLIKEGKIEDVSTETQVGAIPGLLRRFFDYFGKTKDVQLAIIDVRKHSVKVPFEVFTADRGRVCGSVEIQFNIKGEECTRALRLLKENNPVGSINSSAGYREFCLEDVTELLRNNLQYVIDTESVSMFKLEEISQNRTKICTDLVAALKTKSPYWANYGMEVYYSSVQIDENEYEELERRRFRQKLEAVERELEYESRQGESDQKIRLSELKNRERYSIELDDHLTSVNLDAAKRDRVREIAHRARMTDEENEEEYRQRQLKTKHSLEMAEIYHQQDIRRILDSNDLSDADKAIELEKRQLDLRRIQAEIGDIESERKRNEVRFQESMRQERMKFDVDLDSYGKDANSKRRIEEEKEKAKILMDMRNIDVQHDENMKEMETDAAVKIAQSENEAAKVRAEAIADQMRERLDDYRSQDEAKHRQNMDFASVMVGAVQAANSGNRVQIASASPYGIPFMGAMGPSVAAAVFNCPSCGAQFENKAKFCPQCGKKLKWEGE